MREDLINDNIKPWVPTEDGKNFDTLIAHLEKVIEDGTATNIGIIGPYGSGKSSFIATFLQKTNRKDSIIRVSLASFNDKEKNIINDNALQIGIVQQILYSFDPKKIPLSRFKRISSPDKITFIKLFLSLLVIILYIAFQNNIVFQFLPQFIFSNTLYCTIKLYTCIHLMLFVFLIPSIGCIGWTTYKAILNSRKVSLSIDKVSIGLDNSKTPILDKYLEEILYIFDASHQKRIVILEDMDRFEDPISILTKLREINHLLNNRGKETIIFIYAVREDLIDDPRERLKFFDFILPIIPFSDRYNSKSRLSKNFSQDSHIPEKLLDILADYIYDHRLIQHIYNEYQFYIQTLKPQSPLKVLAIIAYKNLYPIDFAKLHNRSGYLYQSIKLGRQSSSLTFSQNITDLQEHISSFTEKNIKSNKDYLIDPNQANLILLLLKNEYIIDDYPNYISYFVDGHISQNDRDFIFLIQDNRDLNKTLWAKPLDRSENILSILNLHNFNYLSILNYDLLFKLLEKNWDNIDKQFISEEPEPDKNFYFQFEKMVNIMKGENLEGNTVGLQQEFINGLLGPNGVQKYPYQAETLQYLIINHDLKFSEIPDGTPYELTKRIADNFYYYPKKSILKQIYNLSPKNISDMLDYWSVAKSIEIEEIALKDITSTINSNSDFLEKDQEIDNKKEELLKNILLIPSLRNPELLLKYLKKKTPELFYDGEYKDKLSKSSFNSLQILVVNDTLAVSLFTSVSRDSESLSEDEKIKLWNIYIKKNRELVQNELTPPVLDTIFPPWEILKKGGPFKINNTPDNQIFCKFLKENKSISSYYSYRNGDPIQVNRTRFKE